MSTRFSWVTFGHRQGPDPICDHDLGDHPLAAVVPSLGSIVPGWLLVVPRRQSLAFAALPTSERRELLTYARTLALEAAAFGKTALILEHGPVTSGSSVGCGVDQAHLHVVPLPADLITMALADRSIRWRSGSVDDPWNECLAGQEYYLICGSRGSYVGFPQIPQSQYFRRMIAKLTGKPEAWDYREWPCHDNIQRTIEHFVRSKPRQRAA